MHALLCFVLAALNLPFALSDSPFALGSWIAFAICAGVGLDLVRRDWLER